MVDPLSLAAITAAVTAAAGALGSEAGGRSWAALTALGRRALRRGAAEPEPDPEPVTDPRPVPAVRPDDAELQQLAAVIYTRTLQDDTFAAELRAWIRDSEAARGARGTTVTNVVTGNARVEGTLIQANEVTWHSGSGSGSGSGS